MRIALTSAATLVAALGLAAAPQALAQTAPPAAAQQPAPAPAPAEVTDTQLRSFAKATVAVQKVNARYGPQLQSAAPEQQQALQQQAASEMVAKVEASGLDVNSYNQIAAQVEGDAALSAKVARYINELESAG